MTNLHSLEVFVVDAPDHRYIHTYHQQHMILDPFAEYWREKMENVFI